MSRPAPVESERGPDKPALEPVSAPASQPVRRRPLWRRALIYFLEFVFVVALLLGLTVYALQTQAARDGGGAGEPVELETDLVFISPDQLTLETVSFRDYQRVETVNGTVRADRESLISSPVDGQLDSVSVREGSRVQSGQVIAQVAHPILAAQRDQAQVEVARLEAELARLVPLANVQAVARSQVENTQFALEAARANVATLDRQIDRYTIEAPFSGTITSLNFETGDQVAPGVEFARIATLNDLEVLVLVSDEEMPYIRVGDIIPMEATIGQTERFTARVREISATADPVARQFNVTLAIQRPPAGLQPGVLATARLTVQRLTDSLLIPEDAVFRNRGEAFVFMICNGLVRQTPVETGIETEGLTEITWGLSPGDVIVVQGPASLVENAVLTSNPAIDAYFRLKAELEDSLNGPDNQQDATS